MLEKNAEDKSLLKKLVSKSLKEKKRQICRKNGRKKQERGYRGSNSDRRHFTHDSEILLKN